MILESKHETQERGARLVRRGQVLNILTTHAGVGTEAISESSIFDIVYFAKDRKSVFLSVM